MDVDMKDSREAEVRDKLKAILDVSSPEFQAQVRQLADKLGLQGVDHPDSSILLKAICTFVERAIDEQLVRKDSSEQPPKIDLNQMSLGMKSPKEPNSDKAIKILRLMNIEQLRHLQTQINILTVEVQKVTADPKTDLKMGKVGR